MKVGRRFLTVTVLGMLALAALAPSAVSNGAHGDEVHLEVVAQEGGACSDSQLCFNVSKSSVPANTTINVTAINRENNTQTHSYYFDWTGDHAHGDQPDTPASAAEAKVTTKSPNQTGHVEFTIPNKAGTEPELYIWCDEIGHEAAGMHATLNITGLGTDQQKDGDQKDGGNQPTPGFEVIAVLAAAGIGAAYLTRRD